MDGAGIYRLLWRAEKKSAWLMIPLMTLFFISEGFVNSYQEGVLLTQAHEQSPLS